MKQQHEWLIFTFLCILVVLFNAVFRDGVFYGIAPSAVIGALGVLPIVIPFWVIIGGFGLFGSLVGLLNLFRKGNKLKFSPVMKANVGIVTGLVLKLIFPTLP